MCVLYLMLQPFITYLVLLIFTYSPVFHLLQYIYSHPILFLCQLIFFTNFICNQLYAFPQLVPYCINFIIILDPSFFNLFVESRPKGIPNVCFFNLFAFHFIAFFNILTLCNLIFSLAITGL